MILTVPSRTASKAGPTILAVSKPKWSVSMGSITTFDRSPKGCMMGLFSTCGIRSGSPSSSALGLRIMTALRSAVMATTRSRAVDQPAIFIGDKVHGGNFVFVHSISPFTYAAPRRPLVRRRGHQPPSRRVCPSVYTSGCRHAWPPDSR